MLGNLLMDVNKPSLWKNGAGGLDVVMVGGGGTFSEASRYASSGLKAYSTFLPMRLTQSALPYLSDKVRSSASPSPHQPLTTDPK